jgi:glycerophosphoryl diester phosphodiesterase
MPNPWLTRRVLNYAHQGGALEAPSSTLYALHRALQVGATALELDAHLTRDGRIVLAHDPTVDRLTNGTGEIHSLTLEELRQLDAAYRFELEEKPGAFPFRGRGPADREFRIPTLDEVLEAFPRTFLNFDIKAGEESSAACALALAQALGKTGRESDFIVASFDDALTEAFSRAAPQIGTSIGMGGAMAVWQAVQDRGPLPAMRHLALQLPAHFQDVEVVTSELVARAHQAQLAVHVWTVNDATEMERLVALGVDGLITDRPSVCARVLHSRGMAYRG